MSKDLCLKLQYLTPRQKKEFTYLVAQEKRATMGRLLAYLLTINGNQYISSKAFEYVFQRPYTKAKDANIRNESRLLNGVFKTYLGGALRTQDQVDLDYLTALSKTVSTSIFDKEIKTIISKWEKLGHKEMLMAAYKLKFDVVLNRTFTMSENGINSFNKALMDMKYSLEQHMQVRQTEFDLLQAYIAYNASRLGMGELSVFKTDVQIPLKAQYNTIKKGTYSLNQKERIESLAKAIDTLEKQDIPQIKAAEYSVLHNNLALEYFFNRDYQNALKQYHIIFKKSLKIGSKYEMMIAYNYGSLLMKTGAYSEAMVILRAHKAIADKDNGMYSKMTRLFIIGLILTDDSAQVRSMIPENWKDGSKDDYYYLRLAMAMLYYKEGKEDLAIRENTNTLQSIAKSEQFEVYGLCAQKFNTFLSSDNSRTLVRLIKEIDAVITDTSVRHGDIMPMVWLKGEIEKAIH